jgi:hypothetical protein
VVHGSWLGAGVQLAVGSIYRAWASWGWPLATRLLEVCPARCKRRDLNPHRNKKRAGGACQEVSGGEAYAEKMSRRITTFSNHFQFATVNDKHLGKKNWASLYS